MLEPNRQARRAWAAVCKKHIKRGKVYQLQIRHDSDCLIYSTARVCTCNPDRVLIDDRGRILASVANAGSYDPLELCGVLA